MHFSSNYINQIETLISGAIFGTSFAIFFTAAMDELYHLTTARCLTSMLALYNVMYTGIGYAGANIIGGVVYDKYGPRTTLLAAGQFVMLN